MRRQLASPTHRFMPLRNGYLKGISVTAFGYGRSGTLVIYRVHPGRQVPFLSPLPLIAGRECFPVYLGSLRAGVRADYRGDLHIFSSFGFVFPPKDIFKKYLLERGEVRCYIPRPPALLPEGSPLTQVTRLVVFMERYKIRALTAGLPVIRQRYPRFCIYRLG